MKRAAIIIFDFVIIGIAFIIAASFKTTPVTSLLHQYEFVFPIFFVIWFFSSLFSGKYSIAKRDKFRSIIKVIIISNFIALSISTILFFTFSSYNYSRFLVLGTILISTVFEVIVAFLGQIVLTTGVVREQFPAISFKSRKHEQNNGFISVDDTAGFFASPEILKKQRQVINNLILEEAGEEVLDFISKYISATHYKTAVLSTTTRFNVLNLPPDFYNGIINLHRINDLQYVNKFMEAVNQRLPEGGIYIGNAETYTLRKQRILKKLPPVINYIFYTIDYFFTRVMPKVLILKKMYFSITRGENRVISRSETLGRLFSCGFMVIEEKQIGGALYFAAEKIKEPDYNLNPTYGPLIKLNRVGLMGKPILVYKFRTMHPYAEYIQSYVFESNNLAEGGKFENDFRVTTVGKILRKFWLDELPMFINLFRGDLKLVGVRPLSMHYLSLYPLEFRERRIKYKPGLIPPYYADMPKTLDDIVISEQKYLDKFDKNPKSTDFRYFFLAWYNIIFKNARSK